jgi:type IV pilus assembly protein PilC
VEQGLDLVENLLENDDFRKKVTDCKESIAFGKDLATALHSSNIFTGTYARMATIAEKTGAMDEAMFHISEEYEHSVNTKINQLISMIEPTLVIVLSVIVGIILFSVMLPLLGIMSWI